MRNVIPGHSGGRQHRKTLGQLDPHLFGRLKQREQAFLLGMIGARRITGSRTDALIRLFDKVGIIEPFARRVAPEFVANALMKALGKSLSKPVGQRLQ